MNREPCLHPGCSATVANITGYCRDHVNIAHQCVINGCTNRVSAYSKNRGCREHYRVAAKTSVR